MRHEDRAQEIAAERAERESAAALRWMDAGRLRRARWRAGWALWRTDGHPKALTAAATIWFASGRYEEAVLFAEQAADSLSLELCALEDTVRAALLTEAATTGVLASCHQRNGTLDWTMKTRLAEDALHWFNLLVKVNPRHAKEVAVHPALRDLRPTAWELRDEVRVHTASPEVA